MYDSTSCSYAGALDLKGPTVNASAGGGVATSAVKQENWPYRGLACGSTFQQLKQSVEKAKQALADRGGYLAGAFSPPPRPNPSAISPSASITGESTSFFHRKYSDFHLQPTFIWQNIFTFYFINNNRFVLHHFNNLLKSTLTFLIGTSRSMR